MLPPTHGAVSVFRDDKYCPVNADVMLLVLSN